MAVMPRVASSHTVAILVIALLACTGFVYAHRDTPGVALLSDDFHFLAQVHSPTPYHILRCLLPDQGEFIYFYYRPLTTMLFLADHCLWGFNSLGFHMSNLLLHLVNAALVYYLGTALIGSRLGATAGAALFLLFPLQPEAVTWISGRCDLLATVFMLLCLILYWNYRESDRTRFLCSSILCGILGILSKESMVSFPVLLLALEVLVIRRKQITQGPSIPRALMLLLVMVPFYLGVRWYFLGELRTVIYEILQARMADHPYGSMIPALLGHLVLNSTVRPLWVIMAPFNAYQFFPERLWLIVLYGVTGLLFLACGVRSGTFRNRTALFLAVGFSVSLLIVAPFFWVGRDLQGSRFLYGPSSFVCLYLGNLLFGKISERAQPHTFLAHLLLMAALGTAMAAILSENNQPWVKAGRMSRHILEDFKNVSPPVTAPAKVLVQGLPDNYRGAYIFRLGFPQAVNLSCGTLPPYRYPHGVNKLAYEFLYVSGVLPLKVIPVELIHDPVWEHYMKVLAILNVEVPRWITDTPADYDHFLRWDASGGHFLRSPVNHKEETLQNTPFRY